MCKITFRLDYNQNVYLVLNTLRLALPYHRAATGHNWGMIELVQRFKFAGDLAVDDVDSKARAKLSATYQNSYALLIGINTYRDRRFAPLARAEQDARDLASLLSAPPFNFQYRMLLGSQATQFNIQNELNKLQNTEPNDRVLVYYAGHGYAATDLGGEARSLICCYDTMWQRDFTALELDRVTRLRRNTQAKHIAFIFDSCFSGQAVGLDTRAAPQPGYALSNYLSRKSYQAITAGAVDQPVSDSRSMTRILIEALQHKVAGPSGLVTFSTIGLYVRDYMANFKEGGQTPQFNHLLHSQGGEFVFCLPGASPPAARPWRQGLLADRAPAAMRDVSIYCHNCEGSQLHLPGKLGSEDKEPVCENCGRSIPLPPLLRIGDMTVWMYEGTELFAYHLDSSLSPQLSDPIARLVAHPTEKDVWGLNNLTLETWEKTSASGKAGLVPPGKSAVIERGLQIDFGVNKGRFE